MLSFPFNASTPILYYNKDLFRAAGLDPEVGAEDLARGGRGGEATARGQARLAGFTTSWPVMDQCREFSAFHNLPISTKANGFDGLDAVLIFNNPVMVRHIAQLAEWQASKVFDYSGRGTIGGAAVSEGRMRHLHRLVGDARRYQGQFEIRGRLRHVCRTGPMSTARRKTTIIGGATLWVLRDRPRARIQRRRKILRLPVKAGGSGRLAPEHRLSCRSPAPLSI